MKYVIVGNGIAAVTAAQSIVRGDSDAEVHVLGAEPYPYYQRPRLWEFLAGEINQEDLYFRPLQWYADKGIQMHLNTPVSALDPSEHQLTLANADTINYDRLLLATGARCFTPPLAGADKAGVFTLRKLDDALAMKNYAQNANGAVVIGGGLLGLETARALTVLGLPVTVIEFAPHLLPRQLDKPGADMLREHLESIGIHRILTNAETKAILGDEHATGVQLKDGQTVQGELVLISTGIRSRLELPRQAGLAINRGVTVDEQLRTSAADVYAAGDVAEFQGVVYGIIPAAIDQARTAASNMVSPGSVMYHGTIPSTTLKVVGINLTCLGDAIATGSDVDVLRFQDTANHIYKRLTLKNGVIIGAILMGDKKNTKALKQLISARRDVSAYKGQLLDKDFDLKTLAKQTQ